MIIFLDVDGTLVNSFPGIASCVTKTCAELGLPQPSPEQLHRLPGPPLAVTFRNWGYDAQTVERAVACYRRHYTDTGWQEAELFAGFADALPRWKAKGYTVCTATSKGATIAARMLERLGVAEYFDFIGGADDEHDRRHAKAEVIEWVLDSMDLRGRTGEILMVGDRSHDYEGAGQFGIRTALVGWGHGTPAEWEAADFFAPDFPALEDIIASFNAE